MWYSSQIKASITCVLLGVALLLGIRPSLSAPVVLVDDVMDRVTAGQTNYSGGAVIGNNAASIINNRFSLGLSGQAQSGARGLNLVNSTESAVANTINIWEGNVVTLSAEDANTMPVLEINQINQVSQQQVQSATLSGYTRSDADQTEITHQSGSQSYSLDQVNVSNITDRSEEIRYSETTSSALVDTELVLELDDRVYIRGHLGQGIASSGQVKATFDGGEAEFALGINGGISASAGISVESEILGSSASLEAEASAEVGLALLTTVELPRMEIELSGAGCGVILGSCQASGSSSELVITFNDNSTLNIFENHQSGASEYSEEYSSIYRSPFQLGHASADYIVIDDSSLVLDSEVSLELSESAQKDVEAMNIVNAISSHVANATNISRASQFESVRSKLILNQLNVVRHGH